MPWQKMTITDCPMVLSLLLEKNSDQNAGELQNFKRLSDDSLPCFDLKDAFISDYYSFKFMFYFNFFLIYFFFL